MVWLVSSSLEHEECPVKGSSARVAKDERIQNCEFCPGNVTDQDNSKIAHLRLAEEGPGSDIPQEGN